MTRHHLRDDTERRSRWAREDARVITSPTVPVLSSLMVVVTALASWSKLVFERPYAAPRSTTSGAARECRAANYAVSQACPGVAWSAWLCSGISTLGGSCDEQRSARRHRTARPAARHAPTPARFASAVPSTSTCCLRATRAARPARTSRPGSRTPRRADTSRRGASSSPTILSRRSTGGSATTRVRASATAPNSTAPCRSIRSSASSATWRSSRAGRFDAPPVHTGKRVLVIGAGPSGLSAAYHLARLGHEVEIRDAGDEPGGMMRYGIPAYRLPRDVLAGEIDRIAAMGVRDDERPPRVRPGGRAGRR